MRVECEAELNKTIADVEEFMLTNGFTETTVRTYWYNWKQIEKHAIEKGYSCFSREWMLDFAYSKCSDPNARRKRQAEYNRIRAANLLADFIEYKAVSHSLNFVPDNPLRIVVRSAKAAMKALNYSESSIEKFEDIGYHLAEYGHANGYFEFKSEWIMAAVPKVFESTSEMTSRAQRRCLRPAEILCHFNKFGSIPGKMAVSKTFPAKYDALIQAKELYCETHRLSEACRHSFNVTCNDFAAYLVNSNITLEMLNIDMVRKYFIEKSYHATSSKKLLRYVFRSLFKTAYELGTLKTDLSLACDTVRLPSDAKIPNTFTPVEIKNVLDSVNRETAIGKRNYAILLLAARYGIRAGDIRDLQLCNFNWGSGELRFVQGKTKKPVVFQMSDEVGEAIIDYLKNGRPNDKAASKNIFVLHCAPYTAFDPRANLQHILVKYLDLSGVGRKENQHNGMHTFRHSLASNMLALGVQLPVISEALGHESTDSTGIYVKVDVPDLRKCTLKFDF